MDNSLKEIVDLYLDNGYLGLRGQKHFISLLKKNSKVKSLLKQDQLVSVKLLAAGAESLDVESPSQLLEWESESGLEGLAIIVYDLEMYDGSIYVTNFGTDKSEILRHFKGSVRGSYKKLAGDRFASNLSTRLADLNKRIARLERRR